MAQPASAALEGSHEKDYNVHNINHELAIDENYVHPQHRELHDPAVPFSEYHYYAQCSRQEEAAQEQPPTSFLSIIFPSKSNTGVTRATENVTQDASQLNTSVAAVRSSITDEEWTNASRALRTASRGAIFYLITTDILGPFGLPYAFASMGWGPGIALYTIFAILAAYSGYLLSECFLGLDSYEYPIRHVSDLAFRLYGPWTRHLFSLLQGIQLLINVGLIVISNGEALSQAARFRLCFIICCLIWALVGLVLGQIRTLQKFGWLANLAVWFNVATMAITIAGAAHYAPNYSGAGQAAGASIGDGALVKPVNSTYPPVTHSPGLPASSSFSGALTGAMQAVFAYGGAMVFPEFMAEMRRPRDFLGAMVAAQTFIYACYMLYGLLVYAFQGQYAVNPSYLGISGYGVQTAGNVFAMLAAAIAAALYGNIGVKLLYNNIAAELCCAPPLTSRLGKGLWCVLVPGYWAVAFVLAAAIPNFSGLTAVVAAVCILQFTYSFPPLLATGFWVQRAVLGVEGSGSGEKGVKRWMRGVRALRRRERLLAAFNVVYCLGALALAGLGTYSAVEVLVQAFKESRTTSFVCESPLEGK